jgi:aminoglycoside phosphotransferase (APT) family kinase protein
MSLVPPELMSAEERDARAADLRQQIARQWLRFAIVEGIVIWLPFVVFMLLYVTDVVPESSLVPAIVVAVVAEVMLVLYWVFGRIWPRSSEPRKARGRLGGLSETNREAVRRSAMMRAMAAPKMHPDEIDTDVALVRRLLAGQFPQWADLTIEPVVSYGTDHDIYRLGDRLAARLPRIGWATRQAAKEGEWLPKLAPHLPLAVPLQLAMGQPAEGYPFEWSVYEWLPGENANGTIADLDQAAVDLAAFVKALRQVDATDAPPRPPLERGAPLAVLDEHARRSIAELGDRIDGDAALRSWEESLSVSEWDGAEVWVHGDLLPGNLLVVDGRLSAVIDWGGLNVGDPACDLQPAWNVFAGDSRARYRAELRVDDASWLRGRGWALFQAVMALPYYWDTNPGMIRQASDALAQVLAER